MIFIRGRLNAFFLSAVIVIQLVVWYLGVAFLTPPWREVLIILAGGCVVLAVYALNRAWLFYRKLDIALQHVLENNYQIGISLSGDDEFGLLSAKFTRAVEQIAAYDRLREKAVERNNRILNIFLRNTREAILLFELEPGKIKINRAAQELFSISQDELSIESVVNLEANQELKRCYQDVLKRRANTMAVDLVVSLPILKAKSGVSMKMIAIKDKEENLHAIICFLSKTGAA